MMSGSMAQRRGGLAAICGAVLATAGDVVMHTSGARVPSTYRLGVVRRNPALVDAAAQAPLPRLTSVLR
jgi:hypothetical protein